MQIIYRYNKIIFFFFFRYSTNFDRVIYQKIGIIRYHKICRINQCWNVKCSCQKKKNLNIVNNIKSNGYQNLNCFCKCRIAFCQKRQPKCTDIFFFFYLHGHMYTQSYKNISIYIQFDTTFI